MRYAKNAAEWQLDHWSLEDSIARSASVRVLASTVCVFMFMHIRLYNIITPLRVMKLATRPYQGDYGDIGADRQSGATP